MRMVSRFLWVTMLVGLVACEQTNGDFCDADTPCTNPDKPFCDIDGNYPASEGIRKTCIPDPTEGGDCDGDEDCTNPSFPICEDLECRACRDANQCSTSAPVCSATFECGPCTGPSDCAAYAATPVCSAAGACVECDGNDDCGGTTPICSDAGTCSPCTAHAQCDSGLCDVGTGACVPPEAIAYVSPGAGGSCTQASPCGAVQAGVAAARTYVLVAPGTYSENVTVGGTTSIVGRGASIRAAAADTPALLITDGANVTLEGLTVADGHGSAEADGIRCVRTSNTTTVAVRDATLSGSDGAGVDSSGCNVSIDRSTVSGNAGGGIVAITSTLTVRNSFLFANGAIGPSGTLGGGIRVSDPSGPVEIEWSTIADNSARTGVARGIRCENITTPLTFLGVIITGEGEQVPPADSLCTFDHSDLVGFTVSGTNISDVPTFLDAEAGNYHLAAGSAGIDQGGTTGVPAIDFDGEARPNGPQADIGADEVR